MVKIIFTDGEYEYDNRVVIFFETLKNHAEDFGYLAKIDLTGIALNKEEFDNIMDNIMKDIHYNMFMYLKDMTWRQREISRFLGLLLEPQEWNEYETVTGFCSKHGLIDTLKFIINSGNKLEGNECCYAAEYGHLECLKYAHENGCPLVNIQTYSNSCTNAMRCMNFECLKYAHEHGCPFPFYVGKGFHFGNEKIREYLESQHLI